MYIMFDMILPLVMELIVCYIPYGLFQDKRKYSACDLKCRYFTLWGRSYDEDVSLRVEIHKVFKKSSGNLLWRIEDLQHNYISLTAAESDQD